MPGGSSTLTTIRDAIEPVLATVSGLQVYDHEPKDLDYPLPAAVLGLPKLERSKLGGDGENELGRWTWKLTFKLYLHLSLDEVEDDQNRALQLLGQVVGAFDNDETLGNSPGVKDTKVELAEPSFTAEGETRQMVIWTCDLAVMVDVS